MKKHPSGGVSAVVTLFLITAVMAGLLAMVNAVTAGPIADGLREKTEKRFPAFWRKVSSWKKSWKISRMKPAWWRRYTGPPRDMW